MNTHLSKYTCNAKKEIENNPIRTILTTIPLFIAISTYLWENWFPPASFIEISSFSLRKKNDGYFKSDIQFVSEDDIPIRNISGYYIGIDNYAKIKERHSFSINQKISMSTGHHLEITFKEVPHAVVICAKSLNARGATSNQEINMRRYDNDEINTFIKDNFLYVKTPINAISKNYC